MKVAVTSASGLLGSAIIKQLISDIGSENVVGIARTPSKAQDLGCEIRQGDYLSRDQFDEALKGIDAVILLSGNAEPDKRIGQHRNVIEAAKAGSVKKIVYTSILGDPKGTAFSPIIASNRQTEQDIQGSGMDYVIGRNSLYIEPDVESLEDYKKAGEIANSAGSGKCTYTSRFELAAAYARMAVEDKHNSQTYNLGGQGITQQELADSLNEAFSTNLTYRAMSAEDYLADRQKGLGEFLGTVIGGIYDGISKGDFDQPSHFENAAGRAHKSPLELIKEVS